MELRDLIAAHQQQHLTELQRDELGQQLMDIARKNARQPRWRNYSMVDEWQSDAVLAMVKSLSKIDTTRTTDPEAYLARVCRNTFISHVRHLPRKEAGAHLGDLPDDLRETATDGRPEHRPEEFVLIKKMGTHAASAISAIPEGKRGLWRSPTMSNGGSRVVWVIQRYSDWTQEL